MQIRLKVLEGKSIKEIREALDIPEGTWDSWYYRETHGFREKIMRWKAERFLALAEDNMPELLAAKSENVRADMTKFVMETAGKEVYSKKSELDLDFSNLSDAELDARIAQAVTAIGKAKVSDVIGGENGEDESQPT